MDQCQLQGRILGFWATILSLSLVGCQAQSEGLKLGTLLPISGDLSSYGSSMQNAARLLVDTVNQCGGVLGHPVTLISEDDQTDPAVGAAAMTKLTEVDRVAAVIGAASSAVSSAAIPIAVRNRVVQISPSSTSPIFTERARKGEFQGFWLRTAPPDTFQGKALAQLFHQRGLQRVAILAINNDYGNGLMDSFIPTFKALGGQIANENSPTRYDPKAIAFDAEIRQVEASQPDGILLIAYPETGSLILKSAYELGLLNRRIQWIATDGLKDVKLPQLVGKDTQGRYIAAGLLGTAVHPTGNGFETFRDRFRNTYNTAPTIYDPNTWDAAALSVLAAEAAKATTGKALRDRIRAVANPPGEAVTKVCDGLQRLRQGQDIDYQGASGTVDLNAEGDVTGSYDVWQIQPNGGLKIIETVTIQK